jgi:hypothetical protein
MVDFEVGRDVMKREEERCEICGARDLERHDTKAHDADEKLAVERDAYGPEGQAAKPASVERLSAQS